MQHQLPRCAYHYYVIDLSFDSKRVDTSLWAFEDLLANILNTFENSVKPVDISTTTYPAGTATCNTRGIWVIIPRGIKLENELKNANSFHDFISCVFHVLMPPMIGLHVNEPCVSTGYVTYNTHE